MTGGAVPCGMAQRTGFNKGGGLGGMARGEMGWKGNECEERETGGGEEGREKCMEWLERGCVHHLCLIYHEMHKSLDACPAGGNAAVSEDAHISVTLPSL